MFKLGSFGVSHGIGNLQIGANWHIWKLHIPPKIIALLMVSNHEKPWDRWCFCPSTSCSPTSFSIFWLYESNSAWEFEVASSSQWQKMAKVSQNSSERPLPKWELKICHKCQQENISSWLTQSSTKQTSTHSLQIQHQITVVAFILVSDWDVHLMMPQVGSAKFLNSN